MNDFRRILELDKDRKSIWRTSIFSINDHGLIEFGCFVLVVLIESPLFMMRYS